MRRQLLARTSVLRGTFSSRAIVRVVAIAAIVLSPTAAALQQRTTAHAAGDSGTFILATGGTAAEIDPASEELASSNMIQRNMDEQLVGLVGQSLDQYRPILATSWKSNANKTVWTFYLRHGVKFHSGREMTAADVQYSFARTMKAGLANSYVFGRFLTNPDKQIKVVDKYTIECDLDSPQPLFLGAVVQEYSSSILDSTELKQHIVKGDYGHAWAMSHDLGTGPYMLKDWQHGQQVTLTKFPGYWGGWSGKHFSTIIVKTVPETATRRELVEKGAADLTFLLTPQDYDALSHEQGIRLESHFTTEIDYMAMTQGGALLSPLARQAMSYAFNYDAFLKAAYGKYARRAYGPIPSVLLGYDPNMFHYHMDMAKAKALFLQAGVKPGTTLTFDFVSGSVRDRVAGAILTAQLAQLGITLKSQGLTEDAFNTIFYKTEPIANRPNLMTFGWWPDYNDPWDMSILLIYSKSAGSAGANAGYYHNATVDRLMDASKNADRQTLIRNFKTIQDITSRQDPPAIWLSEPAQVTVMRSDIQGMKYNPLEIQTYDFYTLYR